MKNFLSRNLLALFLLTTAIPVFLSCNKDKAESTLEKNVTTEDKNANLEMIARAISASMQQSIEFRELIKQEALKKFDYQYDVLYSVIKDKRVGDNTVHELVSSNFSKIYGEMDLNVAISKINNLQLSLPIGIDDWKTENFIPTIAVIPVGLDESQIKTLNAIDKNGIMVQLSASDIPTVTTLAIGEAERIDKNGNVKVNSNGIVVDPTKRISVAKAIDEAKLKSAKIEEEGERLINVVSDEEFAKIQSDLDSKKETEFKKQKASIAFLAKQENKLKLKSAKTETRINLTGFSNQPRTIAMSWDNPTNLSCTYKIWSYENVYEWIEDEFGGFYSVSAQNVLVGETYATNYSYTTPFEGTFNIYIEAWANGQLQTVSNYLCLNASNRHQYSNEYISKIYVSESRAHDLEGWYCQDLEFEIKISQTGNNNSDVPITAGEWIYVQYGGFLNASVKDTYRVLHTELFSWNRGGYAGVSADGSIYNRNNGVYTVGWVEDDQPDADKKWQIAKKAIELVGSSFGISPAITEMVIDIGTIGFDIDYNDEEIGTYDVTWWDYKGKRHSPAWGFAVDQNYY